MDLDNKIRDVRVEMGVIRNRMDNTKYVDQEDQRQFAVLVGELDRLQKQKKREEAPMFLRENSERFVSFLESLKNEDNQELIESVKNGYSLLN